MRKNERARKSRRARPPRAPPRGEAPFSSPTFFVFLFVPTRFVLNLFRPQPFWSPSLFVLRLFRPLSFWSLGVFVPLYSSPTFSSPNVFLPSCPRAMIVVCFSCSWVPVLYLGARLSRRVTELASLTAGPVGPSTFFVNHPCLWVLPL